MLLYFVYAWIVGTLFAAVALFIAALVTERLKQSR
jgi:hypothetical protein